MTILERNDTNESSRSLPGAFAMTPGSAIENAPSDEEDYWYASDSSSSCSRPEQQLVQAYVVDQQHERERIRSEVLAQVNEESCTPKGCWTLTAVGSFALLGVAITVAILLVPQAIDSDRGIIGSLKLRSSPDGHFLFHADATAREDNLIRDIAVTAGSFGMVLCRLIPCMQNPGYCQKSYFEPGCNVTNYECGELCPNPPNSCVLVNQADYDDMNPTDYDCVGTDCYECTRGPNGEKYYELYNHVLDIDCLHVGIATRPENGAEYRWAIACGPIIAGEVATQSLNLGEYTCFGVRSGAGYQDGIEGVMTVLLSCDFLTAVECGCTEEDAVTFWVEKPENACDPDSSCPIKCSRDQLHMRDLCRRFPGDIEWLSGANPLNMNLFTSKLTGKDSSVEIYVRTK